MSARPLAMLDNLRLDLASGVTQLFRRPGPALLAILALALGIGSTSALFSVVRTVLLNPLPFQSPDRLVMLWESERAHGDKEVEVSWSNFQEWLRQAHLFQNVAAISSVNLDFALLGQGGPQQVEGTIVSGSFWATLGVQAAQGRVFTDADDRPGAEAVAVLSHRLWQSRYGGDPGIVGTPIRLDGEAVRVIGVMGPEFDFPRDVDVWLPLLPASGLHQQPHLRILRCVGRLQNGVDERRVRADMAVVARRMEALFPKENRGFGVLVTPLLESVFGNARLALWVLLAAVVAVLLIACANVAHLLLARAAARHQELAVRAALGADRGRLLRQLLTESLLLALLGGAAGLVIAHYGLAALVAIAPEDVPRIRQATVDGGIAAFGASLALATVLLFGLVPALRASRIDVVDALKQGGSKGSQGPARSRLRNALVVGELAFSVLLLIAAGLLVRSLNNLQSIDPGFRPQGKLTFRVTLAQPKYAKQEDRRAFYQAVLDRVRALPGVASAGAVLIRPLSGPVGWDNLFTVEGQTPEQQSANPAANYEAISPGYFRTMEIPLLAGRDFAESDVSTAPGVVVLNASAAKRFFPNGEAVGRRLKLGPHGSKNPWLTVVGVAQDVRYREWETARADLYIPFHQRAQHRSDFVVRTSVDPLTLASAIRREVARIDPDQPVSSLATLDDLVGRTLARPRFNTLVLALFSGCAVLLAVLGVYGVLSYAVAQRTRELGIRIALGSRPREILSLVLGSGLRLALLGTALGTLLAVAATRLLSTLLFGVRPLDALTYAASAGLLLGVALLACLVPALRATRVNPVTALQSE